MQGAPLMRRFDVKYAATEDQMKSVLQDSLKHYHILEVGGLRISRYQTQYFDTPEMVFYHEHHSDRGRRRKVRIRTYCETGEAYLEVKCRQPNRRTVKTRVPMERAGRFDLELLLLDPVFSLCGPLYSERLQPSVSVSFRRVTLVNLVNEERVTLDFDVSFQYGSIERPLHGLVVSELKQLQPGPSVFQSVMRRHGIRPGSLSKYCLGTACLHGKVKTNLFKARIRKILELTET